MNDQVGPAPFKPPPGIATPLEKYVTELIVPSESCGVAVRVTVRPKATDAGVAAMLSVGAALAAVVRLRLLMPVATALPALSRATACTS